MSRLDLVTFRFSVECRCAIGIVAKWCDFPPCDVTFLHLAIPLGDVTFLRVMWLKPGACTDSLQFILRNEDVYSVQVRGQSVCKLNSLKGMPTSTVCAKKHVQMWMCRSRWWFLEARVDGGMRATLFPARFAGAEYGCSLLDWLSRLMSSYELCKKKACDAPQCPEMCRPRTCRKRPIGANRTGLEMTATGYDGMTLVYSIQFSSVHLCVTRYITLPVLSCSLVMSLAAGPGHSWSFCGAGGGLPKPSQSSFAASWWSLANTVSTPCVQIMTDEGQLQRILNSD